MDDILKKLLMPMDARSNRGVFSRGKPVYRHGSNSPKSLDNRGKGFKSFDLKKAIEERMKNASRS